MKRAPVFRINGVIDRPKQLLIQMQNLPPQHVEVVIVRAYAVFRGKRAVTDSPIETVGLLVTPDLLNANQPLRYSNDILVRGQLDAVTVLRHAHDLRRVEHMIKESRGKILQAQSEWFARYIHGQPGEDTLARYLAKATQSWPGLAGLAAYQAHVAHLARHQSTVAIAALIKMQAHQRELNAAIRAELDAIAPQLLVMMAPHKVITSPLLHRQQRPRDAVDLALVDDPDYLHQQAQEIQSDYQFAKQHNLPLLAPRSGWDAANLAQWQAWVDEVYRG
ncbi:hypothetical protein [Lacticaseibacillus jixiensis]|uniref:hypothetical protein n=1 Tax=Lacticaseibacillus jixiensis TaxID=3231926 RepID=UPI0036F3FF3E